MNVAPLPISAMNPNQPSPQKTSGVVTQQVRMELEAYAGPIPPPSILRQYDEIQAGFADRIMTQFEEQGRHRRKLESRVIWDNIISSAAGQVMAFIIFGGTVAGGMWLLAHDKSILGLGAIITALGTAGWVFRKAETARKADLLTKREAEKKRH